MYTSPAALYPYSERTLPRLCYEASPRRWILDGGEHRHSRQANVHLVLAKEVTEANVPKLQHLLTARG